MPKPFFLGGSLPVDKNGFWVTHELHLVLLDCTKAVITHFTVFDVQRQHGKKSLPKNKKKPALAGFGVIAW